MKSKDGVAERLGDMTIEKEGSKYYLYCDICGEEVDPKNPRVEVVIEDYEGGKPCYERKGKN